MKQIQSKDEHRTLRTTPLIILHSFDNTLPIVHILMCHFLSAYNLSTPFTYNIIGAQSHYDISSLYLLYGTNAQNSKGKTDFKNPKFTSFFNK
uniref:SFRICE_004483 n=1 Tax=Spodoptera frugiperda TaxID=7108 RepID=A0A2H1VHP5_SPOFR